MPVASDQWPVVGKTKQQRSHEGHEVTKPSFLPCFRVFVPRPYMPCAGVPVFPRAYLWQTGQ